MTAQRGNQRRAQFFCNVCLNFSGTQEAALKHKTLCSRKVSKMPHPRTTHWNLPKFNISFKFHLLSTRILNAFWNQNILK